MNARPDFDERLMAAIAHGSIVANGLGILVGLVIWMSQRDKSAYASGQGLQAAVYQLLGMIAIVTLWVIWGVFYALTFIPLVQGVERAQDGPPSLFWVGLGSMLIPMAVMVVWGLYGLWGAFRAWQGEPFRYAIIGRHLIRA
jgi:uncharacterized Tic20 family protein